MWPGSNGYKVCETLRAEEDWTRILMLTAKDGEWDQVEGLDTGADDYLTKPFSFPVLVARLRALIRRGAGERPTVLESGGLRLDPAARRVGRGGAEVPDRKSVGEGKSGYVRVDLGGGRILAKKKRY